MAHEELPPAIERDPNPGVLRGALHFVYDVAWVVATVVGSPWLWWKSRRLPGFGPMVRERAMWDPPQLGAKTRPRVLIHGVSVGEVKGAVPLVDAIETTFPEVEVVISSTTNTGMQVAREEFPGRHVVRFPADLTPIVRRFLRAVEADLVLLIELEIWPNFLRECNRRGAPVAVVNGRITGKSHARYVVFRRLLPQFNRLSLICVQDEEYEARFLDLQVDPRRVVRTGSIKADRLRIGPVDPGDELRTLIGGREGQLVLVAGSTHDPEERYVVQGWQEGAPEARLVLVPRHPQRSEDVVRELSALGVRCQRLTALRAGTTRPDPSRPCIVDTIGELERVYGLADLVFVGGSLIPHGGQNMLEPAAQGRPVVFGPYVANFTQEAALLLSSGACQQIGGPADLGEALRTLAGDPDLRARMGAAGLETVQAQKGATTLTLDALSRLRLASLAAGRR